MEERINAKLDLLKVDIMEKNFNLDYFKKEISVPDSPRYNAITEQIIDDKSKPITVYKKALQSKVFNALHKRIISNVEWRAGREFKTLISPIIRENDVKELIESKRKRYSLLRGLFIDQLPRIFEDDYYCICYNIISCPSYYWMLFNEYDDHRIGDFILFDYGEHEDPSVQEDFSEYIQEEIDRYNNPQSPDYIDGGVPSFERANEYLELKYLEHLIIKMKLRIEKVNPDNSSAVITPSNSVVNVSKVKEEISNEVNESQRWTITDVARLLQIRKRFGTTFKKNAIYMPYAKFYLPSVKQRVRYKVRDELNDYDLYDDKHFKNLLKGYDTIERLPMYLNALIETKVGRPDTVAEKWLRGFIEIEKN